MMRAVITCLLIHLAILLQGQTISGAWYTCQNIDMGRGDSILFYKLDSGVQHYCKENNCTNTTLNFESKENKLTVDHHLFGCPDDALGRSTISFFYWTIDYKTGDLILYKDGSYSTIKHSFAIKKLTKEELCLKKIFGQSKQSYDQDNLLPEKKAKTLIEKLKQTDEYPFYAKDTLIDLNGDHFKDILVEYYGLAGTGLKNRVTVYLYDNNRKEFKRCDQLCDLGNPNFHFDKKIVTGYYIAMGGGYAVKLKWNGLRLDSLEKITIEVEDINKNLRFTNTSFNFITRKTSSSIHDHVQLPAEYKYFKYDPLIKRKDP